MNHINIIIEVARYTLFYFGLGLVLGTIIENFFPKETRQSVEAKPTWQLIMTASCQIVFDAIVVFYVNKIIRAIPPIFEMTRQNEEYFSNEIKVSEHISLALTFLAIQPSLTLRISEISRRLLKQSEHWVNYQK